MNNWRRRCLVFGRTVRQWLRRSLRTFFRHSVKRVRCCDWDLFTGLCPGDSSAYLPPNRVTNDCSPISTSDDPSVLTSGLEPHRRAALALWSVSEWLVESLYYQRRHFFGGKDAVNRWFKLKGDCSDDVPEGLDLRGVAAGCCYDRICRPGGRCRF